MKVQLFTRFLAVLALFSQASMAFATVHLSPADTQALTKHSIELNEEVQNYLKNNRERGVYLVMKELGIRAQRMKSASHKFYNNLSKNILYRWNFHRYSKRITDTYFEIEELFTSVMTHSNPVRAKEVVKKYVNLFKKDMKQWRHTHQNYKYKFAPFG